MWPLIIKIITHNKLNYY